VGLLESRRAEELASLVRRFGGEPVCAPSVREVPSAADHRRFIGRLAAGHFRVAIFLTGVGVKALMDESVRASMGDAVLDALGRMTLAGRGPKPIAALKRYDLSIAIVTDKPHTVHELLIALEAIPLEGVPVALVHYGERHDAIAGALRQRGGQVDEVCLYEWALPEDLAPLRTMAHDVVDGRLDAVLFTSQVQLRHLQRVAAEAGIADQVVRALAEAVVVGAVGPVCAGALREHGIVPDVLPAQPNSPALVAALADYFELTRHDDRSRA
jgi:uroporphyrinogen-III synthase